MKQTYPTRGAKSEVAVSTIEEVRAAEKEVQRAVDALSKAPAQDPNHLSRGTKESD